MRVKVCGMTQLEQVDRLEESGVSFAGFIFYPKSARYVLRHLTTGQIRKENSINKVGVFVNASIDHVLQMVDECRLHMVQLHGDETPKYCEQIADYISVIKAFRLSDNDNIEWMIRPYRDVTDMFLFSDVATISLLKENGFKGFLIGETFMKEQDPSIAFARFAEKLKLAQHES